MKRKGGKVAMREEDVPKYQVYIALRRDNMRDLLRLPSISDKVKDNRVPVGKGYVIALDVYGEWHVMSRERWKRRRDDVVKKDEV